MVPLAIKLKFTLLKKGMPDFFLVGFTLKAIKCTFKMYMVYM